MERAENVENLPDKWRYYEKLLVNSPGWLNVMVCGNYGSLSLATPVFGEYNDHLHSSREPLEFLRDVPLLLGWDFGRTGACVLAQYGRTGQVRVLREFRCENMSVHDFVSNVVKPVLVAEYDFGRLSFVSVGDPSGAQRGQECDDTNFGILEDLGIPTVPCSTNKLSPRLESVRHFLRTLVLSGKPGLVVGPDCPFMRKAFLGGYHYPAYSPGQAEAMNYAPVKDEYSHIMDALQYVCYHVKEGLAEGDGQREDWGLDRLTGTRRVKTNCRRFI